MPFDFNSLLIKENLHIKKVKLTFVAVPNTYM
jgi:hypothetical protein